MCYCRTTTLILRWEEKLEKKWRISADFVLTCMSNHMNADTYEEMQIHKYKNIVQ